MTWFKRNLRLLIVASLCLSLGILTPGIIRGVSKAVKWFGNFSYCGGPPDAGVDEYRKLEADANKLANAVFRCTHKDPRWPNGEQEPGIAEIVNNHRVDCNLDTTGVTPKQIDDLFQAGIEAGHLDYSETLNCYTFDCPASKAGCRHVIWEDGNLVEEGKVVKFGGHRFQEGEHRKPEKVPVNENE